MVKRIKKSGFNRRVKRRMMQLGLTQVEIAGALGWSLGCFGHLITGRTKMVMADRIFPLADVLQCDPRWLALGDEVKAEEVLGMLLDDAYAPRKLLSPAQAEKALGKDGAKQIQDLITESRGVQLAPLNDKREAVTPAIQAFTEVEDAA